MLFSSIAAIYRVIYTPSIIMDATRDTPIYRTNLKRQVVHNNFFHGRDVGKELVARCMH